MTNTERNHLSNPFIVLTYCHRYLLKPGFQCRHKHKHKSENKLEASTSISTGMKTFVPCACACGYACVEAVFINYLRSLGSWCIKGTDESLPRADSSVPLVHHDPSDLSWIIDPDLDHPKGTHP